MPPEFSPLLIRLGFGRVRWVGAGSSSGVWTATGQCKGAVRRCVLILLRVCAAGAMQSNWPMDAATKIGKLYGRVQYLQGAMCFCLVKTERTVSSFRVRKKCDLMGTSLTRKEKTKKLVGTRKNGRKRNWR